MQGNVNEILFDCFSVGYEGAPTDGSARTVPGNGRIGWFERAGRQNEDSECALRTYHGALFGIRMARDLDDNGEDAAGT